jgi:hypothetical protein
MDIQKIMNQVKVGMYGYDVGDEALGVYGHMPAVDTVTILEKRDIGNQRFSYLVMKSDDPSYVAHAHSYGNDGKLLIDNARIIGSEDPSFRVESMAQARTELGF